MSDQIPRPPPTSFRSRFTMAFYAFVRALVRLLLVILILELLGAGIYFGLPALYRRFVQPIETNLVRVNVAQ